MINSSNSSLETLEKELSADCWLFPPSRQSSKCIMVTKNTLTQVFPETTLIQSQKKNRSAAKNQCWSGDPKHRFFCLA